jgi:hypothetical protein
MDGSNAYGKNDRLIEPMGYIGLDNTFCRDSEYSQAIPYITDNLVQPLGNDP